jgi:hypothetical protein
MQSNDSFKLLHKRQNQIYESSKIIDNNNSNYFAKQNNLLNSWIRQQGHTNEMLPKIRKKARLSKYLGVNNGVNNQLPSIIQGKDKLLSTYYSKCIDEVFKQNEPRNNLYLIDDPKELVYLKKLPEIKMSVRGIGKTKDSVWEITNDLDLTRLLTTGYSRYF